MDYIPGTSRKRSVPVKTSTSWYSLAAPGTPSVVSHPERLVPDPWFPPAQLTPAVEVPGEEERAEEEGLSSPSRDHRASPDIQFVSDHEVGP